MYVHCDSPNRHLDCHTLDLNRRSLHHMLLVVSSEMYVVIPLFVFQNSRSLKNWLCIIVDPYWFVRTV